MNKQDLGAQVAKRLGISIREGTALVDLIADAVVREIVAGGRVTVTGFGAFERATRAPRVARDLRSGERIAIPPRRVVVFRAAPLFQRYVDGRQPMPEQGICVGRITSLAGGFDEQ